MTRLFVAAWPPDHICAELTGLTDVQSLDGERRVPPENWHITLRFIGTADIARVIERLEAVEFPAAQAMLGPGVIDLDGRQIVVPVTGVDQLARSVRLATDGLGEHDDRPFFGHLTLARVRAGVSPTLRGTAFDATWEIDEIALVTSETLPSGAVYDTVATFPTVATRR